MKSNTRQNAQTSRKGWRPRKTSDARLANDIAASIMSHAENGTVKTPHDYTKRTEIIEMVESLLGKGERIIALNNTYLVTNPWLRGIAQAIIDLYEEYGKPSDDHNSRWELPIAMFIASDASDMGDWQGHDEEAAERFNAGLVALYEMLDYRHVGAGDWTCGYDISDEYRVFRDAATSLIDEWVSNKAFDTFCDDPYGIVE